MVQVHEHAGNRDVGQRQPVAHEEARGGDYVFEIVAKRHQLGLARFCCFLVAFAPQKFRRDDAVEKYLTLQRAGTPYALRPTELYQTLMISSGGLTDRLRRLEERGLITRESSETDQRSVMVKLSAKGKALIYKAYAEDMAVEFDLLAPLSKSERADLARLLSKLLLGLEETLASK